MASAVGRLGYHGNQREMWVSGGRGGTEWDTEDAGGQHGGPSKLGRWFGGVGTPKRGDLGVEMGSEA